MSSFPDGNKHRNPLFSQDGKSNAELLEEARRAMQLPFADKVKFFSGVILFVDLALFFTIVSVRLALTIF